MWIDVDDVIAFTGLKPKHLNLDKDDTVKLTEIVEDWIEQCEGLIKSYTHNTFCNDTIPASIKNITLRLVSNMVTLAIQKRDSPIIKVNDWTIQTVSSDIFTDDLKEDLKPYIKDSSNDYSKVGFFAITGSDE